MNYAYDLDEVLCDIPDAQKIQDSVTEHLDNACSAEQRSDVIANLEEAEKGALDLLREIRGLKQKARATL